MYAKPVSPGIAYDVHFDGERVLVFASNGADAIIKALDSITFTQE